MDKIILENASVICKIGFSKEERYREQELIVSTVLFCDTKKAAATQNLNDTINYAAVCKKIKSIAEKEYILLEAFAEDVAIAIIENFPITKIRVHVKKPCALRHAACPAVEIERP
jgi:dihydroneopterin aldolase